MDLRDWWSYDWSDAAAVESLVDSQPLPTLLHYTCLFGHSHVVRMLVEKHGADVNSRHRTQSPLQAAISKPGRHVVSADLVEYLLDAGADNTAATTNGLMSSAIWCGNPAVLAVLHRRGAPSLPTDETVYNHPYRLCPKERLLGVAMYLVAALGFKVEGFLRRPVKLEGALEVWEETLALAAKHRRRVVQWASGRSFGRGVATPFVVGAAVLEAYSEETEYDTDTECMVYIDDCTTAAAGAMKALVTAIAVDRVQGLRLLDLLWREGLPVGAHPVLGTLALRRFCRTRGPGPADMPLELVEPFGREVIMFL